MAVELTLCAPPAQPEAKSARRSLDSGARPGRRLDPCAAEHRVAHERARIGELRPRAVDAESAVLAYEVHPVEVEDTEEHLLAAAGPLHHGALGVDDDALADA